MPRETLTLFVTVLLVFIHFFFTRILSRVKSWWSSPKILWKKEQALTGLRIKSRKAALEAPLLAEEVLFDPIGQGIEAELGNSEDPTSNSENMAG